MGNHDEIDSIGERIAEHAAHLDAATHRLLTDLRAFDEAGGWDHQGFKSFAGWLAWRVGWDPITAREHVRVAVKLGGLPLIDDALRRGELSYSKVRAITRVATAMNEVVLLEQARYSTGAQLERSCKKYAAVLRHDEEVQPIDDEQRRYVKRSDTADGMVKIEAVLHPEEAALVWAALERIGVERCREGARPEPASAKSSTERAKSHPGASAESDHGGCAVSHHSASAESHHSHPAESHQGASAESSGHTAGSRHGASGQSSDQSVPAGAQQSVSATSSGQVSSDRPSGVLPDRSASALQSASAESSDASAESSDQSASAELRGAAGSSDQSAAKPVKPFDRAEALVALAHDVLRGTRKNRAPIDLVVTVVAETLAGHGDIDVGVLADGTCVSAAAVRRLACDCGVTDVVEDERGVPLSVGRKRRTIPGTMKRALLRRDVTCRFPGCTTRVFLEGHHIEHWVAGGETKLDNIVCLCSHHHRYVHEYGFTISLPSELDADLLFLDPRGRPVLDVPEPPLVRNSGWPAILEGNAHLAITSETLAHGWDGSRVDYDACVDALVVAE